MTPRNCQISNISQIILTIIDSWKLCFHPSVFISEGDDEDLLGYFPSRKLIWLLFNEFLLMGGGEWYLLPITFTSVCTSTPTQITFFVLFFITELLIDWFRFVAISLCWLFTGFGGVLTFFWMGWPPANDWSPKTFFLLFLLWYLSCSSLKVFVYKGTATQCFCCWELHTLHWFLYGVQLWEPCSDGSQERPGLQGSQERPALHESQTDELSKFSASGTWYWGTPRERTFHLTVLTGIKLTVSATKYRNVTN